MPDSRDRKPKDIQQTIVELLMEHWDPIGVAGITEACGEYDSYVGPVYRILAGSRSEEELISYLSHVETKMMGLEPQSRKRLRAITSRLLALDVSV